MRDDDTFDVQDAPTGSTSRSDEALSAEPVDDSRDLPLTSRFRVAVATGLIGCLGLTAFVQDRQERAEPTRQAPPLAHAELAERTENDRASRGVTREQADTEPTAEPVEQPADRDPDTESTPTPAPTPDPGPVAGLTVTQMNNAKAIVRTGRDMGMPRRALIIAVATAMQESNLYNVASGVVPESRNYPHQGLGWDHDSVGLFQQRSSTGWGPVGKLMDPAYATQQFLNALMRISGWEQMRLTQAAQAVQVSAFPEHYAKHESRATEVVDAIVPGWQ